jgi:3-oxoacyl-[acyl-carrier protein] reductase
MAAIMIIQKVMGLLTGKTALVTGATRGIGRAIALRFAEEGANVAFTYRSQHEAALSLTAEIEAMDVQAKGYSSDAASFADAHAVVEDVKAVFGRIDVLVNNAGITKDGLMMRMDEEQWDAVINTNLKSAFNFIHACTPIMARQRGGSIINMSSVVGVSGNAGQCNYAASKAGLIGLSKSIAKEMGPRGIRSNCIAPGFIATDMTGALPDDIRKEWEKQIPLRRGGTPEDVAGVALFLASDLSAYVTGQVISCCGGMNC